MPDVLRSFTVISTDSTYQLAWLDQVDSDIFSHHKEAVNAKATVAWGSASASYEDFDEKRALFKRRQKYELNQTQSARLLFQGLNSDGVGIVHDCLNKIATSVPGVHAWTEHENREVVEFVLKWTASRDGIPFEVTGSTLINGVVGGGADVPTMWERMKSSVKSIFATPAPIVLPEGTRFSGNKSRTVYIRRLDPTTPIQGNLRISNSPEVKIDVAPWVTVPAVSPIQSECIQWENESCLLCEFPVRWENVYSYQKTEVFRCSHMPKGPVRASFDGYVVVTSNVDNKISNGQVSVTVDLSGETPCLNVRYPHDCFAEHYGAPEWTHMFPFMKGRTDGGVVESSLSMGWCITGPSSEGNPSRDQPPVIATCGTQPNAKFRIESLNPSPQ